MRRRWKSRGVAPLGRPHARWRRLDMRPGSEVTQYVRLRWCCRAVVYGYHKLLMGLQPRAFQVAMHTASECHDAIWSVITHCYNAAAGTNDTRAQSQTLPPNCAERYWHHLLVSHLRSRMQTKGRCKRRRTIPKPPAPTLGDRMCSTQGRSREMPPRLCPGSRLL